MRVLLQRCDMHRSSLVAIAAIALELNTGCFTFRSKSFDDARIAEEVVSVLHADHIENVSASVSAGQVRLSGTVRHADQRAQAARDIERIDGVVSVENQIRVTEPGP